MRVDLVENHSYLQTPPYSLLNSPGVEPISCAIFCRLKISSIGFLPLSIWTNYFGRDQRLSRLQSERGEVGMTQGDEEHDALAGGVG